MRELMALAAAAVALSAGAASAEPAPSGGMGGYVTGLIEKACIPLIKGQDAKAVAAAAGLKRTRTDLVMQLTGSQRITLSPPAGANPHVCTLSLQYQVDGTKDIVDTLTAWAAAQNPPLPPLSTGYSPAPGLTGWSWSLDTGQMQEGLVFTAQRTADGKPMGKDFDSGTVLFSYRDTPG
jgi:hypothetical protein